MGGGRFLHVRGRFGAVFLHVRGRLGAVFCTYVGASGVVFARLWAFGGRYLHVCGRFAPSGGTGRWLLLALVVAGGLPPPLLV